MSVVLLEVLVRLPAKDLYNDRRVEKALRRSCVAARVLVKANLWDDDERIPKSWRAAMRRERRLQYRGAKP